MSAGRSRSRSTITKSGDADRGRLDRQLAAGQGRDQQHALLYEIGELLRDPLDPAAEHPDQRGRVPRDLGHRAGGHDRQHGVARRLRGARPDRVPHGRLHVRRAGEDAAGPGVRGLRRRQYRRVDRRLARATARPFIYVDFTCCAWGARPYADGLDGNSHIYANMASQPIEVTESEQPLADHRLRIHPGRDGAGQVPRRRAVPPRIPAAGRRGDLAGALRPARDFRPFGLYGGGPGRPSMNYLNPDRNPAPLPSKLTMTMRQGDLFRHEVAGGGGWGDPLERDPALVLQDVLNEFVSPMRRARITASCWPATRSRWTRRRQQRCARRCVPGAATGPVPYTIGEWRSRRSRRPPMDSTPDLVIFDCDGVLVDSEPIFNRAHADILSQCGYRITPQSVGERFCGISDAEMLAEIEREWGRRLPGDYGDRVAALDRCVLRGGVESPAGHSRCARPHTGKDLRRIEQHARADSQKPRHRRSAGPVRAEHLQRGHGGAGKTGPRSVPVRRRGK